MKLVAVAFLCVVAPTALAQHRIDVTAEQQRLHDPSVGGERYGLSCGPSTIEGYRPPPSQLELTVVSLSPTDLTQGDKLNFEVMVKNIGKETIAIPWSVIGSNQAEQCRIEQRLEVTFTAVRASSPFPQVMPQRRSTAFRSTSRSCHCNQGKRRTFAPSGGSTWTIYLKSRQRSS